jgi:hypothetical protein
MDHTPLEQGMFWAGALMASVPILGTAIVLTIFWKKKQQEREKGERGPSPSERVT